MRELLYEAAKHYRRGKALAERGDTNAAAVAFEEALRERLLQNFFQTADFMRNKPG